MIRGGQSRAPITRHRSCARWRLAAMTPLPENRAGGRFGGRPGRGEPGAGVRFEKPLAARAAKTGCKGLDLIHRSMSDFAIHLMGRALSSRGGLDPVKDASIISQVRNTGLA